MLLRKREQTRREGSRGGPASHKAAEARLECTSRAYGLVHSAKRNGQSCCRSAAAHPSATLAMCAAGPVCGKDGQRARRRAPCARSVRGSPETSLRSPWSAPVHFRVMPHTRRTGTMRMCAHGRCQGKGARESLLDWALHAIGSGRGSGCVLLCNGLLRLCVSVDRERSRGRPLPAYVSRALKTVDFRVSPAPPGLAVSGLRDPRWAGRAARSVRWRQGAR